MSKEAIDKLSIEVDVKTDLAGVKTDLLEMVSHLKEDVFKLRETNSEQLSGAEIMAINALCNVYKTLNEAECKEN